MPKKPEKSTLLRRGLPDDNRLELVELCQNHPPMTPGVEKLSALQTHGRNGQIPALFYFWADREGEKRRFPDSCCFFRAIVEKGKKVKKVLENPASNATPSCAKITIKCLPICILT